MSSVKTHKAIGRLVKIHAHCQKGSGMFLIEGGKNVGTSSHTLLLKSLGTGERLEIFAGHTYRDQACIRAQTARSAS